MAEMVASALVQEGVSGALSLVVSNREEKASQGYLLERLEMAHSQLEFALERSSKMPITDVSLLRRRMVIKCAFRECTVVLLKHKQPGDEEAEQATVRRKIMRALLPSVWYFSSRKKDLLTCSVVARFEWFAEMADKFVRDVESGCSLLACYKFWNPIVTQLLEGKRLKYNSHKGKKSFSLRIGASRTEDHGVMAHLYFQYSDPESPMNTFSVILSLRLSESTDIVGIGTKCLQSLRPNFKCLPEVPTELLAYLSTHVQRSNNNDLLRELDELYCTISGLFRPDPVCCTSELTKSCSSNTFSSELSGRFPEQVAYLSFWCNVSSGADYNLRSSTRKMNGKTMKAWPYLELYAAFAPHSSWEQRKVSSLHHMEETIHTEAINFFSCQPKQTEYSVLWSSAHGSAYFNVSKPLLDMRCAPRTIRDGSVTRRESKRKR